MDEKMGKLYNLSDYRNEILGIDVSATREYMTFVLEGEAAAAINETAQRNNMTPGDVISRALSLVVGDSELRSEGYDGPVYSRPKRMSGAAEGWLTRSGLLGPEQIKIRPKPEIPPAEP